MLRGAANRHTANRRNKVAEYISHMFSYSVVFEQNKIQNQGVKKSFFFWQRCIITREPLGNWLQAYIQIITTSLSWIIYLEKLMIFDFFFAVNVCKSCTNSQGVLSFTNARSYCLVFQGVYKSHTTNHEATLLPQWAFKLYFLHGDQHFKLKRKKIWSCYDSFKTLWRENRTRKDGAY